MKPSKDAAHRAKVKAKTDRKFSKAQQAVLKAWKLEVCDRREDLDPDDQLETDSLFIGFAIGKGLPINEANDDDFVTAAFNY